MRIVLQRVSSASVVVSGSTVGQIRDGVLALVGVGQGDTEKEAAWLADKTVDLRMFSDEEGKMNRSLIDMAGALLAVSQFTLLGDCQKGRRPAFTAAAPPDQAKRLYEFYADRVAQRGVEVQRGVFAADMQVSLVNDGPVTFVLDRLPARPEGT